MAIYGDDQNAAKTFIASKLHVEAIQTVVPTKQTDPGHSHRVLIPESTYGISIFQQRFQIVMLYNALEELSGWVMAGWMKESLSWALAEESVFAGRLRRSENGGDSGDRLLEVVANDSGVRLVEATVEMELVEFLDHLKENAESEVELAFWENINDQNPQFSPLFYVQVTNFKCGGFSIGISCSLLVADPFSMISFLKKWSDIHNKMVSSRYDKSRPPIFHLLNLRRTGCHPSLPIDPRGRAKAGQSMILKIASKTSDLNDEIIYKNLAALCIHEAEQKLGRKAAPNFSLFLKDSSGNVKMESISTEATNQKPPIAVNEYKFAFWDDLEVEKVQFSQVMKAAHVSSWINSVSEEGFLMIFPSSEDGLGVTIIVTFPG